MENNYEGYIFYLGDKNIMYVVVYEDCEFKGKQLNSSSYIGLSHWHDSIKIMGNINIYENKELLKKRTNNDSTS